MTDPRVVEHPSGQATSRESVKAKVDSRVNAEITGQATAASTNGQARVVEVATQLRDRSLDETVQAERTAGHARTAARGSQFVDYAFYLVYSLLAIRFVLALIAAESSNGFVRLIGAVTEPFYAPFRGIVASPTAEGGFTFVVPILIALVVFALLHAAVNGLLRMVGTRKTAI